MESYEALQTKIKGQISISQHHLLGYQKGRSRVSPRLDCPTPSRPGAPERYHAWLMALKATKRYRRTNRDA